MATPGPTDDGSSDKKPASPFLATPGASTPTAKPLKASLKQSTSRPPNAPALSVPTGTPVSHFNTMLSTLINFLKSSHPAAKSGSDLAVLSNIRDLDYNEELQKALRAHDRIEYIAQTDLYAYKPEYLIRNKVEALQKIQAYGGRGGMPMVKLEESWKDAKEGVEELERDGRVLVWRPGAGPKSTRERPIKMVFYDEVGRQPQVDAAFKTAWRALRTPQPDDLDAALANAGISRMAEAPTKVSAASMPKQKKKQGNRSRRKRMTNLHMKGTGVDLSKDYPAPTVAKR